jgi:hypothetical protein
LVKAEFDRGASIPVEPFPADSTAVSDSPRLSLVVVSPDDEWDGGGSLRDRIADWTKNRGKSSRLYPGALVWCVKKPGRDLRDKIELWLAWKRVQKDVRDGVLGSDYEKADLREIEVKVKDAEEEAKDEVWGGYRFVVLADNSDPSGLKPIDLGAGHSSGSETLCGRVIAALKSEALLNESVGAGYIDRHWPPAFKDTGAWPLASLRQSFLNGALTRLLDPDSVLRGKIVEFVDRGDFGLGSGPKPDGTYERLWFRELMPSDEVAFEPGVVLVTKAKAEELKKPAATPTPEVEIPEPRLPVSEPEPSPKPTPDDETVPTPTAAVLHISGFVPPELWNRLGVKLLSKLRSGADLRVGIDFSVTFDPEAAKNTEAELRQALEDLGLSASVKLERIEQPPK